jgi:hypothetical protein
MKATGACRWGGGRGALVIVGAAAISACASVPLVHPTDPILDRAQRNLARTTALAAASGAPPADQVLFLQAEGLYRYRFQPPPRTFASSLAVAAAAATDFPAFQALAGALDLLELRLRAYDGAVHLWETLLLRSPSSPLRPLTLYRLGWAYRNAAVSGLPRASGDEAWTLLAQEQPQGELTRLAVEARRTPWKSKSAATAWSALPGAGQIYVGETLNGVIRLSIGVVSLAAIAVPAYVAYQRRQDLGWSRDWPLLVTGLAGLIVLSVDYTTAYQDAIRGVVEHNERVEAAFEAAHPEAP